MVLLKKRISSYLVSADKGSLLCIMYTDVSRHLRFVYKNTQAGTYDNISMIPVYFSLYIYSFPPFLTSEYEKRVSNKGS